MNNMVPQWGAFSSFRLTKRDRLPCCIVSHTCMGHREAFWMLWAKPEDRGRRPSDAAECRVEVNIGTSRKTTNSSRTKEGAKTSILLGYSTAIISTILPQANTAISQRSGVQTGDGISQLDVAMQSIIHRSFRLESVYSVWTRGSGTDHIAKPQKGVSGDLPSQSQQLTDQAKQARQILMRSFCLAEGAERLSPVPWQPTALFAGRRSSPKQRHANDQPARSLGAANHEERTALSDRSHTLVFRVQYRFKIRSLLGL